MGIHPAVYGRWCIRILAPCRKMASTAAATGSGHKAHHHFQRHKHRKHFQFRIPAHRRVCQMRGDYPQNYSHIRQGLGNCRPGTRMGTAGNAYDACHHTHRRLREVRKFFCGADLDSPVAEIEYVVGGLRSARGTFGISCNSLEIQNTQHLLRQGRRYIQRSDARLFKLPAHGPQMDVLRIHCLHMGHVLVHGSLHRMGSTVPEPS